MLLLRAAMWHAPTRSTSGAVEAWCCLCWGHVRAIEGINRGHQGESGARHLQLVGEHGRILSCWHVVLCDTAVEVMHELVGDCT